MELGLFLLHAVPGLLLMGHGSQKLFGWLGGHGPDGTRPVHGRRSGCAPDGEWHSPRASTSSPAARCWRSAS